MLSGSKIGAAFIIVAGVAAATMFTIAILKARPLPPPDVSSTPPTPGTTTTVQSPVYDVLSGVAGLTPIQQHPDTNGVSIAPTNPS